MLKLFIGTIGVGVKIQHHEDYFELVIIERSSVIYSQGDTLFGVRVQMHGRQTHLAAESNCWVAFPSIRTFATQLSILEELRTGSAILESMSPGELQLEIKTIDRAGHVAALGQVGVYHGHGGGPGTPYLSTIKFCIPFCPTELKTIVRELNHLAVTI